MTNRSTADTTSMTFLGPQPIHQRYDDDYKHKEVSSRPVGDFLSSRSSAPPGSNVKADPPVIPVIPPPSVTAQNSYAAPPLWPGKN
ncbi:hypothetical protein B9Z55_027089 [Caenorhabditis nigoni]|nr:hypothetical protein B9Z55_027089 [Caenorhabditis nigoni]